MIDMSDYIDEVRLSRAFSREFEKYREYCDHNNMHLPPELLKAFDVLMQYYTRSIENGKP